MRSPQKLSKNAAGFTLLEVLLVIGLLAVLSLATFSSIRLVLKDKETVDTDSEFLQEARAVLSIIEHDLKSAYLEHYEDLGWDPLPKSLDPNEPPPPLGQKPVPVSIFQGKENEIFLSARSHQRMSADAPENEFHFVTFQMNGDKLIRAESPRAVSLKDRENPDRFKTFTLLERVKSLKFAYWDRRAERWTDAWDSERAETLDTLPDAVKIELEYAPDSSKETKHKVESYKISTAVRILESTLRSPKK